MVGVDRWNENDLEVARCCLQRIGRLLRANCCGWIVENNLTVQEVIRKN
jgi:hypothetical protein